MKKKTGTKKAKFVDIENYTNKENHNQLKPNKDTPAESNESKVTPFRNTQKKKKKFSDFTCDFDLKVEDYNPFISSDEEKDSRAPQPQRPHIMPLKDKSQYEYQSIFDVQSPEVFSLCIEMLNQLNLSEYIEIIQESFPELTRSSIIKKIVFYNFDIDKLLSDLYNEREFPFISEDAKKKYLSGSTKTAEEMVNDISELKEIFPVLDVEIIEAIYSESSYDLKKTRKNIIDNKITTVINEEKFNPLKGGDYVVKKDVSDEEKAREEKRKTDLTFKELSKLINDYDSLDYEDVRELDINEYESIRKQLFSLSRIAWSQGRYKDARNYMAKSKEYKCMVEKLIKKRKIKIFKKNNCSYYKREDLLDLHGLSVTEAKEVIQLKLEKEDSGSLTIITGKGIHSNDRKAVLYPVLLNWLKKDLKIKCRGEEDLGQIVIYK